MDRREFIKMTLAGAASTANLCGQDLRRIPNPKEDGLTPLPRNLVELQLKLKEPAVQEKHVLNTALSKLDFTSSPGGRRLSAFGKPELKMLGDDIADAVAIPARIGGGENIIAVSKGALSPGAVDHLPALLAEAAGHLLTHDNPVTGNDIIDIQNRDFREKVDALKLSSHAKLTLAADIEAMQLLNDPKAVVAMLEYKFKNNTGALESKYDLKKLFDLLSQTTSLQPRLEPRGSIRL